MYNEIVDFAAEMISYGFDAHYAVAYACDVFNFSNHALIMELLPWK